MISTAFPRFLLSSAVASLVAVLTLPATGQMLGGPGLSSHAPQTQQNKPAEPPPPAVPGSRVGQEVVAPAGRSAADLQPNDALFDAINRGDLVAARDAVNRGADLNARNVLGMTPLDLSIDLGRNNISFLLLSLRPAPAGDDHAEAKTAASTLPAPPKAQLAAHRAQPAKASPATHTARFASGDGGRPIPNAGFLGFDMGHETH